MAVISTQSNLKQALGAINSPLNSKIPANFTEIENEDGTVEIEFNDSPEEDASEVTIDYTKGFYANLVEDLDETFLSDWGQEVLSDVTDDENSRKSWLNTINLGLDLLGIEVKEKNEPFQGACSAQHPLLLESAVKFQSKASSELLPADGPVKTTILGNVTDAKEQQANRVKKHMNWLITEKMTEYYNDTEKLLLATAIYGSSFKKTYYDAALKRPVSEYVPADQFIVPHNSSDLQRAPRFSHILYKTENQFNANCATGLYKKPEHGLVVDEFKLTDTQKKAAKLQGMDINLGGDTEGYTLYEHYCFKYVPGIKEDKGDVKKHQLALPFIITIDANSGAVVGVRRNWDSEDETFQREVMFTHWQFVPGFGFYSFGLIHLLGNIQLSLTSSLRSLIDAAQFANLQGGFKLKGTRIVDDGEPINPGQFKEIEAAIMDINKAIMPLPFKEPSQTLFSMLQFLDTKGQKFADSTEQVIADSTNYGPVGTTLALLDASTKFFSAIHKRLHLAQREELRIISSINRKTLGDEEEYNTANETNQISAADYGKNVTVVPVSDPNISSNAHRMAKAQTLFQIAQQSPQSHDMREVLKKVYNAMDFDNLDKILPPPEEAVMNDPLTDIRLATQGKPIKAFEGQPHDQHIMIKQAFLQDPMSGSNPMMQQASTLISANVQEHMFLKFMESVKAKSQMGQPQQQPQEQQDPMVMAAQAIAQQNQAIVEQQMAQQQQGGNSEQAKAEASKVLAQAELKNSETEAVNIQLKAKIAEEELRYKYATLEVEKLKEINKMMQVDKKLANDITKIKTTKGLDAIMQSLTPKQVKQTSGDKGE